MDGFIATFYDDSNNPYIVSMTTLASRTGRWTMIATILASSMAFIDSTALNVILPSLQTDLEATGVDLFWVLNSYLLMLASLIIVGGSLGDKKGRVHTFRVGIIIFLLGSVCCGFSPSTFWLIVSRTVQGVGGALMIPGSLAIISAVFSSKEKGTAIGTWSAATTIVMICGPIFGGTLGDLGLWRYIFFINVPIGIFCIYALNHVSESREEGASKIDWPGAVSLILSLGFLTFGFLEMPEWGMGHWMVTGSIGVGVLLLIAFLAIESRSQAPMIPLELFRNRSFSGVNLLSFFLYAGLGGLILFLSLNIIQIQGYTQLQAGLTFLPFSLIMVLFARKMGKLTDTYGARRFLIIGPALAGVGMGWLSEIGMTGGPSDYWVTYFPGFLVFAVGMAITVVPLTTEVMSCVSADRSGIASGINNSVTRISGTFMNAIAGALAIVVFANFIASGIPDAIRPENRSLILEEALKLGDATPPDILSEENSRLIASLYREGFLDTYKLIGRICAALALLSSLIAFLMIKSHKK